ncbi:uncharacterized protein V1516DRAFT_233338 [Lipomyces oligophaga]|uniref:uncharacterized protein n=1 Tax=Lipomyces oligophaga TaxID=45792 RepID=UPI0034CEA78F
MELLNKYRALESAAVEEGAGLHGNHSDSYTTVYDLPPNFVDSHAGKKVEAIVERILNGDRLLVRMITSGLHIQVPVLVAGIRCPRSALADSPGEPYGDAAKWYVETRLLQRSITLDPLSITPQGVLIAVVIHPAGIIAEKLLESGLASVSDWHSNFLGAAAMGKLRASERLARSKGLNMWQGVTVSGSGPGSVPGVGGTDKSFSAIISRIISADTICVRNTKSGSGEEQIVQLASIRGPRPNDPKQAPFISAAREFVRKLAIGKHVKVTVLFTRPKTDNFDARDMVSIEFAKPPQDMLSADLACCIIENGYATVIRHRKGETDDRSPIWDLLLETEAVAVKAKKGIHGEAPPPERIVNASESNARASAFLPSLQRQKRIHAIVEFVNTGSRLRLLLPRENARIKFNLAGISTPRVAMANAAPGSAAEKSEPFGDESREFTARRILQRDVEIDVTHADHAGGFFGLLHIPGTKDTFARALLEEGLGQVDEYSAQEAGVLSQLQASETIAQEQQKGLWKAEKGKAKLVEPITTPAQETNKSDYLNIAITRIADDGSFSYIILDQNVSKLKEISASLTPNKLTGFAPNSRPRNGDIVVFPIPETKLPARFRVTHFDNAKKTASLVSVDFGTFVESAPLSKLRTLPITANLTALPALAKSGVLRIVKFPAFQADYLDESVTYFYDLVWTAPESLLGFGALAGSTGLVKKMIAVVDGSVNSEGATIIELVDATSMDKSINNVLIEQGWAYIPSDKQLRRSAERNFIGTPILKDLRAASEAAKHERKGLWEYGDVTPEDD